MTSAYQALVIFDTLVIGAVFVLAIGFLLLFFLSKYPGDL